MLQQTFLHLPGISERGERKLWAQGIQTLEALRETRRGQLTLFSQSPPEDLVVRTIEAIRLNDIAFFAEQLPKRELYRLALAYPRDILFLDIETTGLSRYYDHITLIGWGSSNGYSFWIKGEDPTHFLAAVERAKLLVTFNGTLFDLPFLRKEFPLLRLPSAHIDLRFLARRVGFRGGQKAVEAAIGVRRTDGLADLRGSDAPVLWQRFIWGDLESGRRLLEYNHDDIRGLAAILIHSSRTLIHSMELQSTSHVKPLILAAKELAGRTRRSLAVSDAIMHSARPAPSLTLNDLWSRVPRTARVVGIDLTGSATRPSGWCLLDADEVRTSRIGSDSDLIDATLATCPTLVSIDSPLSLPRGRRSVLDSDPGREKYGILRQCERELFRRGVRVYPCLIPSMQQLTRRGIELARALRSKGIPVIESFPGAAQDVLGLPRKRASEELLSVGLQRLGLNGPFTTTRVSHDELDAITSALVGLFHLADCYEALGTETEGYLIVPAREPAPRPGALVVGLSGPIGSGKTTAAEHLKHLGFQYVRYSRVLAAILKRRRRPVSRETLQELGLRLHRHPGQRWLNQQLLRSVSSHQPIVVDGLRWPDDYSFLFERFGPRFVHVAIQAPLELRLSRASADEKHSWDAAQHHGVEAGSVELQRFAHFSLVNTGTVADLQCAITKVLAQAASRLATTQVVDERLDARY